MRRLLAILLALTPVAAAAQMKEAQEGKVKNINRSIGAWHADWKTVAHMHEVFDGLTFEVTDKRNGRIYLPTQQSPSRAAPGW